jgi:D-beta-D-heptose 7-phosphate kinase/D-beta-D-heptose 1-phosphate adenosyltransferase
MDDPSRPIFIPPVPLDRAEALIDRFADLHILVVGDAMLDKFIVGRVTRISPEAPVPVVAFRHEMRRLGGAANVAHNITSLGARAALISLTGHDDAAALLTESSRAAGIAPAFVGDHRRPTPTKVRIVTERNQQVARIDYEADDDADEDGERALISAVRQQAAQASAIVVSDYLKGSITRRVMEAIIEAGATRTLPVLVDPKIPHIDYYAGATLVTPNHHEAETATHMRVRTVDEAQAAARAFRDRVRCRAVLMTRGDQGMSLVAGDVNGYLPATAREVADVTGAGDTVIAAMALGLAAGAAMPEAARIANEAAGLVVAKFGPSIISRSELLEAVGGRQT